jgi:hypothetical protein
LRSEPAEEEATAVAARTVMAESWRRESSGGVGACPLSGKNRVVELESGGTAGREAGARNEGGHGAGAPGSGGGSTARVWFCGAGVGRNPNAVEIGI